MREDFRYFMLDNKIKSKNKTKQKDERHIDRLMVAEG